MTNRRHFLGTLAGSLAGLAAAPSALQALSDAHESGSPFAGHVRTKLQRVGIQLYTVRRDFAADPLGVLAGLAKIGYKEVEFAGYGGKSPVDIRDALKANGLTSPSTHMALNVITADPAKVFDEAKLIGHQWITVPSLPGGPKATVDDWKKIAEQFNAAAAQAKAAGLRFAFHNHNAEFRKIGDVVPLEILLRETDPALVDFEMDIYWTVVGGADPIDLLTRYPTRFRLLHAKDSGGAPDNKMMDVGSGTIDFRKIFALATKNGVRNVFVEHDSPAVPMESAKASYGYLASLDF